MRRPEPYYKKSHKAWHVNLNGRPKRLAAEAEGEEAAWTEYDKLMAGRQPLGRGLLYTGRNVPPFSQIEMSARLRIRTSQGGPGGAEAGVTRRSDAGPSLLRRRRAPASPRRHGWSAAGGLHAHNVEEP